MAARRLASAIEAQIGSAGGAEVRRASLAQATEFSRTDR